MSIVQKMTIRISPAPSRTAGYQLLTVLNSRVIIEQAKGKLAGQGQAHRAARVDMD